MVSAEDRVDSLENIVRKLSEAQLHNQRELSQIFSRMDEREKKVDERMEKRHQELIDFKDEMKNDRKQMNKQWGDLANRMGTVVEDIVRPNIPTICKEYFKCEPNIIMTRQFIRTPDKSQSAEFDIIAVCDDFVLLNETKTTATLEYINTFSEFVKSGKFFNFFPIYSELKLVPVFSAINITDKLIDELTNKGIYAMVPKGNTMDLINFKQINP